MSETLMEQLEEARKRMIQCASEKGLSDQSTIQLSKELDQLLNQYYKEYQKK